MKTRICLICQLIQKVIPYKTNGKFKDEAIDAYNQKIMKN